jgi:hypothetical protein
LHLPETGIQATQLSYITRILRRAVPYASDTTLRHVAQLQRVPPAPLIASTPTRSRHHAAFRAAIRHEHVQVA